MSQDFSVTRQIAIDAGHRIPEHGSKCRHLHGHRYVIEATCRPVGGEVRARGEEAGMVLDFGFLKEEMMDTVDRFCDHGLILALHDTDYLALFTPDTVAFKDWHEELTASIRANGFAAPESTRHDQKLYVVPFTPTAECLAQHFFQRLQPAVVTRSCSFAELIKVAIWETPNCRAEFGVSD